MDASADSNSPPAPAPGLPGVQIRHLAALAAVAGERSFNAASRSLGYVQSAVSQHVAELERIVGERLLERSPGAGQLRLTDAGALLLPHAEAVLAEVGAARADLAALAERSGLRVGFGEAIGARVMPSILAALGERRRDQISTVEGRDERSLVAALERGELDLVFSELPLPDAPFGFVTLLEEPCVLLVPAGSPLAEMAQPPTLAELASLPLIGRTGSRFQERIEAELRLGAHSPHIVHRVGSDRAIRALVAEGVGAAILPRLSIDVAEPGAAAIALSRLLPARQLVLAWHRDRRVLPLAAQVRAVAKGTCERLAIEPWAP